MFNRPRPTNRTGLFYDIPQTFPHLKQTNASMRFVSFEPIFNHLTGNYRWPRIDDQLKVNHRLIERKNRLIKMLRAGRAPIARVALS